MRKQLWVAVLAVLLSLAAICALAQEERSEGDFTYVVAQGYAAITDYSGSDAELVIPDRLGGYPVNRICMSAFQYSDTLVSVTVPEGVISIGGSVPDETGYAAPLIIYDSTPVIGFSCGTRPLRQAREWSVFAGCDRLETVTLPDSVESIHKFTFFNCGARVVIPEGSSTEQAWIQAQASAVPAKPERTPGHDSPEPEEDDFKFGA